MFWSLTYGGVFCRQFVTTYFVVDLLRRVVVSSTVSFFVSSCVDNSEGKVCSDRVIKSNLVCQHAANMKSLGILDIFELSNV